MRPLGWILVAALLVMVGACSDSSPSGGASSKTPSRATAATESAAILGPTYAAVGQYASIVAKSRSNLTKLVRSELAPRCDWNRPGNVDVAGSLVCSAQILTVGYTGRALARSLLNARDNRVAPRGQFFGPPPPEIAQLVAQTRSKARALAQSAQAAQPCASANGPGCSGKLLAFDLDMRAMQAQLAAWDPYL